MSVPGATDTVKNANPAPDEYRHGFFQTGEGIQGGGRPFDHLKQ